MDNSLAKHPAPSSRSADPLTATAEALLRALKDEPIPPHIQDLARLLQSAIEAKAERDQY